MYVSVSVYIMYSWLMARFIIKTVSADMDAYDKDKAIGRLLYLYHADPYTSKTSLYWNGAFLCIYSNSLTMMFLCRARYCSLLRKKTFCISSSMPDNYFIAESVCCSHFPMPYPRNHKTLWCQSNSSSGCVHLQLHVQHQNIYSG